MPDEKKPVPYSTVHGVVRKPEPETVKQRALDPTAPDVANQILNAVRDVKAEMTSLGKTHATFATEVMEMGHKVSTLATDVAELKRWRQTGSHKPVVLPDGTTTTPSGFIKRVSESDATQNLDIASLKADLIVVQKAQEAAATERHETAEKVAAVHDAVVSAGSRVALFWNSPTMRIVRAVATGAVVTYAAARGIHIGEGK